MSRFLVLAGKGKRCSLDLKAISCSSFWGFFFLFKIGTAGVGLCFSNFRYICNTIFSVSYLFFYLLVYFPRHANVISLMVACSLMEFACLSVEGYWSWSLGRQFWGMLFPHWAQQHLLCSEQHFSSRIKYIPLEKCILVSFSYLESFQLKYF